MALRSVPRGASVEERPGTDVEHAPDGDPAELLALLDAEYTLAILETLREGPKPARTVADAVGASRPTVYRRLNRLRDAGLVADRIGFDDGGRQRTIFEATLETLTVDVADGLSVAVTTEAPDRHGRTDTAAVSSTGHADD
jgi:DNA-binding transcriptional ArsR family regulator